MRFRTQAADEPCLTTSLLEHPVLSAGAFCGLVIVPLVFVFEWFRLQPQMLFLGGNKTPIWPMIGSTGEV